MRVGAELRHDMSPSVTSEDQPGCSVGEAGEDSGVSGQR